MLCDPNTNQTNYQRKITTAESTKRTDRLIISKENALIYWTLDAQLNLCIILVESHAIQSTSSNPRPVQLPLSHQAPLNRLPRPLDPSWIRPKDQLRDPHRLQLHRSPAFHRAFHPFRLAFLLAFHLELHLLDTTS